MDVIVCEAPCCPGLREVVTDDMPHLGVFILCEPRPQRVRIAVNWMKSSCQRCGKSAVVGVLVGRVEYLI